MPTSIVVLTGQDRNKEFPIERKVTRIGRDPDCNVQIEDLGVAQMTMRFHDGQYTIYNRGNETIELEGEPIAPQGSHEWGHNEDLNVNPQVILQLQINGDPAPVRDLKMPSYELEEVEDDDDSSIDTVDADAQPKAASHTTEILAIVACGLAIVYLLFVDGGDETAANSARNSAKEFHELVSEIRKVEENATAASVRSTLLEMLQNARVSQIRGDHAQASLEYLRIRDYLQSKHITALVEPRSPGKGSEGRPKPPLESRVLRFVQDELAMIAL